MATLRLQNIFVVLLSYSPLIAAAETPMNDSVQNSGLYSLTATSIAGEPTPLTNFSGKVSLVVNTASKCGFTYQYEGLEKLFKTYESRGFFVLGFPSNDFGKQEPGPNEEIKKFCQVNYGVTFPLFEKAPVTGGEKQPVYKFLTEQSGAKFQGDPGWNFVKFLVDCQGKVVGRYSSITKPMSKKITAEIERLLEDPACKKEG